MFEGLRTQRPELVERARLLGGRMLGAVNPFAVPPEALSYISKLDLRPMQRILVTREVSVDLGPEKPTPGQIALPRLDELAYVEPVMVPARLLYP